MIANDTLKRKQALQLILLLGVISFLGDIIYEGARGVSGQYLQILGANAAAVGLIVGLGEFFGYLVRLASGFFAGRTKSYWLFASVGYGFLVSVPLISLSGTWQIVAILLVLERIGKGIRAPARDTIASHAAKRVGTGYGFGIAELLDQIGAVGGPLIFAFIFSGVAGSVNIISAYQYGYSLFWIPFALLVLMLIFTYRKFPKPEALEELPSEENAHDDRFSKTFWLYVLFVFVTTAGFVSFALVGFHLKRLDIVSDAAIALFYAVAMGIDAIFGLAAGRVYDRFQTIAKRNNYGLFVLLVIPILAVFVPFFVFSSTLTLIVFGVVLFGLVVGVQETILKAAVADMTPPKKRSSAYGIFSVSFGLAFFIGSALAGLLYDYSIGVLVAFLATIELLAIPIFYKMMKANQ